MQEGVVWLLTFATSVSGFTFSHKVSRLETVQAEIVGLDDCNHVVM